MPAATEAALSWARAGLAPILLKRQLGRGSAEGRARVASRAPSGHSARGSESVAPASPMVLQGGEGVVDRRGFACLLLPLATVLHFGQHLPPLEEERSRLLPRPTHCFATWCAPSLPARRPTCASTATMTRFRMPWYAGPSPGTLPQRR